MVRNLRTYRAGREVFESTTYSIRPSYMNNRFKFEAWLMVLIPTIILLAGFIAAIVFGHLQPD